MRFLADEDVPFPSVLALRGAGHDVTAMQEDAPRTPDPEVLSRAVAEGRILITRDRDFGELILYRKQTAPPAVLYIRDPGHDPMAVGRMVLDFLAHDADALPGSFVVIRQNRHRLIQLLDRSP